MKRVDEYITEKDVKEFCRNCNHGLHLISMIYMSNVKDYGMWLVEHKHRVRGGWKKKEKRKNASS